MSKYLHGSSPLQFFCHARYSFFNLSLHDQCLRHHRGSQQAPFQCVHVLFWKCAPASTDYSDSITAKNGISCAWHDSTLLSKVPSVGSMAGSLAGREQGRLTRMRLKRQLRFFNWKALDRAGTSMRQMETVA